jgi:hypothetical protein
MCDYAKLESNYAWELSHRGHSPRSDINSLICSLLVVRRRTIICLPHLAHMRISSSFRLQRANGREGRAGEDLPNLLPPGWKIASVASCGQILRRFAVNARNPRTGTATNGDNDGNGDAYYVAGRAVRYGQSSDFLWSEHDRRLQRFGGQ